MMDNLPFIINRISVEVFLVLFGLLVALVTYGITSLVFSITRFRYLLRYGKEELVAKIAEQKMRIKELEIENTLNEDVKGTLIGKMNAIKDVLGYR
jgi:hypothetical protein